MGQLTRSELHELLGAYALDAVDASERRQVESLLADDPNARAEVDAFREVAAVLSPDVDAPSSLWDRIEAEVRSSAAPTAPVPPVSLAERRERRRGGPWFLMTAAAAVAALFTFGVMQVLGGRDSEASPQGIEQAAVQAKRQPGASVVALRTAAGVAQANVVFLPNGDAWLDAQGLPPLSSDRTYQLWALVGDAANPSIISAGVIGNAPRTTGFHFEGPVRGFVVTNEAAPGVSQSIEPAVVKGTLA